MRAMTDQGAEEGAGHPYYPTTLSVPGFVPALMTQESILLLFSAPSAALVLSVWLYSGFVSKLNKTDRSVICWFAFTGLVHIIVEGYYVLTPHFYKLSEPNFLAEVWKEYSKADSRYLSASSMLVVVESVTAFLVGPACLLAVHAIAARSTSAHPLQLVVSASHLFCATVYFGTAIVDGKQISRPDYFWSHYVLLNSIWVLIPLLIVCRSWAAIKEAFATVSKKTVKSS